MYVVGMNYSTNADGKRVTTLHVSEPFNEYYSNSEAGRGCMGERVESIFVGTYDVSNIEIGSQIVILYEKARGSYQPLHSIQIIG